MPPLDPTIRQTELRPDIQIHLADGRVFEAPRNTPLRRILKHAFPADGNPLIAAIVDGVLRELAWPVTRDVHVEPVRLTDSDGMRIYSRSLSFLLIAVAAELFPLAQVHIDYSVPHGGYFCRVEGRRPLTDADLGRLKARMLEWVRDDRPIERKRYSLDETKRIFIQRGEQEKVRLLEERDLDHLHLYELNGIIDYFYGYMVPSTGLLKTFALETFSDGFVLRFPRREDPTKILPPRRFTALREVFTEYGRWLALLGMRDVASLNATIRTNRIEQLIFVAEALHEKRIAEIAAQIANRRDQGVRLVYIAGPSASGKTTFSKRLSIQLLANGMQPFPLAMDDYFRPRAFMQEQYGDQVDFDSLEALDVERFQDDLQQLLHGEQVTLPRYNFFTGVREDGASVRLGANRILLVEGIHGLNPGLMPSDPATTCFRIFVSALTQLNLDIHNRVSTTDTRLIRRIVRDAVYRGYSAEATLGFWDNVRRGEKDNIFPYQEEADVMFNSALSYELAALKPLVEPLLLQVRDPRRRIEAERLLALLWWFNPCETENIPGNSILREFFGGSTLRDYHPILPDTA